jgi:hypothetical protein
MPWITRGLVAGLVASSLTGCLMNRQITDVLAHDEYNSYKVQTLSAYFAPFAAWQEYAVWNCYRTAAEFRCSRLEYEQSKAGFKPGSDAVAPAPAPAEPPPAEPAEPPPAETPPETDTPAPAEPPPAGTDARGDTGIGNGRATNAGATSLNGTEA